MLLKGVQHYTGDVDTVNALPGELSARSVQPLFRFNPPVAAALPYSDLDHMKVVRVLVVRPWKCRVVKRIPPADSKRQDMLAVQNRDMAAMP